MENYKVSFGKYKNQSIHIMIKDRSYCKWVLKEIKNQPVLIDYIKNYKKYCKEIEDRKRLAIVETKNKMSGFNLMKLPNEILRKIFLMSNSQFYTDMVIKINLNCENQLAKRLNNGSCKCCGHFSNRDGFRYCYDCNFKTSSHYRIKMENKNRERTTELYERKKSKQLYKLPLKYFELCVIPSLKKIETECNKSIDEVLNATARTIYRTN
jgi:hypothetical protein